MRPKIGPELEKIYRIESHEMPAFISTTERNPSPSLSLSLYPERKKDYFKDFDRASADAYNPPLEFEVFDRRIGWIYRMDFRPQ